MALACCPRNQKTGSGKPCHSDSEQTTTSSVIMDTAGAGQGTRPQTEGDGKPLGPPGDHFLNQIEQWGFLGASQGASVCFPAPQFGAALRRGRRDELSLVRLLKAVGRLADNQRADETHAAVCSVPAGRASRYRHPGRHLLCEDPAVHALAPGGRSPEFRAAIVLEHLSRQNQGGTRRTRA